MSIQEWEQYISPLRAWVDDSSLYLWIDPHRHPRSHVCAELLHHIPTALGQVIRETVERVRAGDRLRIVYYDTPPNYERIRNERRTREHRESQPKRDRDQLNDFLIAAMAECKRLASTGEVPRLRGTRSEQLRQLTRIVELAAKRELESSPRGDRRATLRTRAHSVPDAGRLLPKGAAGTALSTRRSGPAE